MLLPFEYAAETAKGNSGGRRSTLRTPAGNCANTRLATGSNWNSPLAGRDGRLAVQSTGLCCYLSLDTQCGSPQWRGAVRVGSPCRDRCGENDVHRGGCFRCRGSCFSCPSRDPFRRHMVPLRVRTDGRVHEFKNIRKIHTRM